jgi:hypothetical protein
LQGAEFFRQRPNFLVDLAEKFGQELATLMGVPILLFIGNFCYSLSGLECFAKEQAGGDTSSIGNHSPANHGSM